MVSAIVAVSMFAVAPADAAAVQFFDGSHVLNVTSVQNAAATLPSSAMVSIYTTTKDDADNGAFDTTTQSKAAAPNSIVIAMNTKSHHLAIRTGTQARVNQTASAAASSAFASAFGNGDYTAATVAALTSLRESIAKAGAKHAGGAASDRKTHSDGVSISGILCLLVGLVVVGAIVALVVRSLRNRNRVASYGGSPGYGPGYGGGPGGPGGPGYAGGPGPGYGPGYGGPGYGGGGGTSPWVAGGVGAVGGGLLGYELGKMEGQHEGRMENQPRGDGDYNRGGGNDAGSDRGGYDNGDYGNDAGFGGGSDADFGGGGGGGDDSF